MEILADNFIKIYESENPLVIGCYSPGIIRLESGRLIATIEIGGKKTHPIEGPKIESDLGQSQGKVFTSDDKGQTWQHRADYAIAHARPFVAGKSVYILGQAGDLNIIKSDDDGEKWTSPVKLTNNEHWHQAPCNVHYANGNVYIVMEKKVYNDINGWNVNGVAPILMRANVNDDLTKRESWVFASELAFRDLIDEKDLDYFGVPFYETPRRTFIEVSKGRPCHPIGWLETNIVQFVDPDHIWYDETGHTFHLWMRAHTGKTGFACIVKVIETNYNTMVTIPEKVPSGKKIVYVPCPGGQMKFHILYDEVTKLYWLLSTQATDSMTKPERLPKERYNLPDNERNRLQLHFSKNCIDWCFAGMVSIGKGIKHSRHYASMVIDGEDLYVLSRSGDENARDPHNGNFISFHTIKDFRKLVY